MSSSRKIAIIGYSGSGKSTLSDYLAGKYGVDVLHIDCIHFLPGWVERPRGDEQALMEDFLNTHDGWIIDGNYTKLSYERRMAEADTIVFMNFNRFSCLWRAYRRYRTYRGKTRSSIAEGCSEKLDCAFIMWILRDSRTKAARRRYRDLRTRFQDKFVTIRTQRALDRLRDTL